MGFGGQSINLLCVLETVALLLAGGPDAKPGKDANIVANQTLFSQVLLSPTSLRETAGSSNIRHRTMNLFDQQKRPFLHIPQDAFAGISCEEHLMEMDLQLSIYYYFHIFNATILTDSFVCIGCRTNCWTFCLHSL